MRLKVWLKDERIAREKQVKMAIDDSPNAGANLTRLPTDVLDYC